MPLAVIGLFSLIFRTITILGFFPETFVKQDGILEFNPMEFGAHGISADDMPGSVPKEDRMDFWCFLYV